MSGTTGHSINEEKRGKPTLASTIFDTTGNTLEVPPNGNTYKVVSSYIEEQGNMTIDLQEAALRKDGKLVQNGTVIAIILPEAMLELANNRAKREKLAAKGNRQEVR